MISVFRPPFRSTPSHVFVWRICNPSLSRVHCNSAYDSCDPFGPFAPPQPRANPASAVFCSNSPNSARNTFHCPFTLQFGSVRLASYCTASSAFSRVAALWCCVVTRLSRPAVPAALSLHPPHTRAPSPSVASQHHTTLCHSAFCPIPPPVLSADSTATGSFELRCALQSVVLCERHCSLRTAAVSHAVRARSARCVSACFQRLFETHLSRS